MNRLGRWAQIVMTAGWAFAVWGPAMAAEAAPAVDEAQPLPSYGVPYLIVLVLIAVGIVVACAPRLYPERERDEFRRF